MDKTLLPLFLFAAAALLTAGRAPRFALARPAFMAVLTAGACLWGMAALRGLPVELMPNVASEVVTVTVGVRGGMAPNDVEALVVRPLEESLGDLPRLKTLYSSAKKDRGVLTLAFQPGVDMKRVTAEAHERVDRVLSRLPAEIEKPVIAHFEENDAPVYIAALTSRKLSPEGLRKVVDERLKDKLLQVPGVATVEIGGGREGKVLVELDRERLSAYGLAAHQVTRLLTRRNVATQIGSLEGKARIAPVRVVGSFRSVEDIRKVVVGRGAGGGMVRLESVAAVSESFLEPESVSRLNGQAAVSLYVLKESAANTLRVVKEVEKAFAAAWAETPASFRAETARIVVSDQARGIIAAMRSVRVSLLCGVLLILLALCLFEAERPATRHWAGKGLGALLVLMCAAAFFHFPDAVMEPIYGALLAGTFAAAILDPDKRAGFIVAGSMPLSALACFILFQFCGITLNVMSLFGLALGLGMLVDNATVVYERVAAEEKKKGAPLTRAEVAGVTDQMVVPLIGATVTNAIVFVPFLFLSKDIQLMYTDVAAAVGASLFASLTVSLTVVPLLAVVVSRHGEAKGLPRVARISEGWYHLTRLARRKTQRLVELAEVAVRRTHRLRGLVRGAAGHGAWKDLSALGAIFFFIILFAGFWLTGWPALSRWFFAFAAALATGLGFWALARPHLRPGLFQRRFVLLGGAAALAGAAAVLLLWGTERDFQTSGELDEFVVFIEMTSGVKLPVSDQVVQTVEDNIRTHPEVGPIIKTLVSRVEGWSSKVYVTLVPRADRRLTAEQVQSLLRVTLKDAGRDVDPNTFVHFSSPRTGQEVAVQIYGPDYAVLEDLAQKISARMEKIPGLSDVKMRYRPGRPEVLALFEPERAANFGLSAEAVAETAHALWKGLRATVLRTQGAQTETIVRLRATDREGLTSLADMPVQNRTGRSARLSDVATLRMATMPNEIFREDKERLIQVTANRSGLSLGRAAETIDAALAEMDFPLDYHAALGSEVEEMSRALNQLGAGIAVMVILVYLVLVVVFESALEPLIIMTTVPLCLVGVAAGLIFLGIPLGTGVLIGVLMLGGVVVNNAIMLIDHLNGHTDANLPLRERLDAAVQARIRPILLTAGSAILGFLPMMMDTSESGALWRPLAVAMVFGLLSSTVFTLFVTPAFTFLLLGDVPRWFSRRSYTPSDNTSLANP